MTKETLALARDILGRTGNEPVPRGEAVVLAGELVRVEKALFHATAQLHAVHNVHQVPFLKGAIGSALQSLKEVLP